MEKEIWVPIYIKENKTNYIASDHGRIKNIKTDHILTPHKDSKGYMRVSLSINGVSTNYKVHRLIRSAFIDIRRGDYTQVNHKDGNKENNNVANLEWCDNSWNGKHAYMLGLKPVLKGELNGHAKITESLVIRICEMLESGISCDIISKELGLPYHIPSSIKRGTNWTHVSRNYNIPEPKKINKRNTELLQYREDIKKFINLGYGAKKICELLGLAYTKRNKNSINNIRI